jgi:hypothetical protein
MSTTTKLSRTRTSGRAGRLATLTPAAKITLGVMVAILAVMGACATQAAQTESPGPSAAEVLPADFPVPPDAQVLEGAGGANGVVTLSVAASVEDVVDFYAAQLPDAGWKADPWEGTNPHGEAARGFILTRGEETAALSVTQAPDERSLVEINMHQPVTPTEGSVMDHQG